MTSPPEWLQVPEYHKLSQAELTSLACEQAKEIVKLKSKILDLEYDCKDAHDCGYEDGYEDGLAIDNDGWNGGNKW